MRLRGLLGRLCPWPARTRHLGAQDGGREPRPHHWCLKDSGQGPRLGGRGVTGPLAGGACEKLVLASARGAGAGEGLLALVAWLASWVVAEEAAWLGENL